MTQLDVTATRDADEVEGVDLVISSPSTPWATRHALDGGLLWREVELLPGARPHLSSSVGEYSLLVDRVALTWSINMMTSTAPNRVTYSRIGTGPTCASEAAACEAAADCLRRMLEMERLRRQLTAARRERDRTARDLRTFIDALASRGPLSCALAFVCGALLALTHWLSRRGER